MAAADEIAARAAAVQSKLNTLSPVIPHRLYLSSQTGASTLAALQSVGVTHILTCAPAITLPPTVLAGLTKYGQLRLTDEPHAVDEWLRYLPAVLKFMADAIGTAPVVSTAVGNTNVSASGSGRSGSGNVLLLHCNAGVSRSASFVLAYLLYTNPQAYTYASALRYLKSIRSVVAPNSGFVSALQQFAAATAAAATAPDASAPAFDVDGWVSGVLRSKLERALQSGGVGDWLPLASIQTIIVSYVLLPPYGTV